MTRPVSALRLAAAVLVTAAAGLVGVVTAAPPAYAATCASASGVSVVVDFGALGGGIQSGCVADGAGKSAASVFSAAGVSLTRVQGMAGFVCRVQQKPGPDVEACNDTPPEDAYWGLWWSDGTSGNWSYSNYGVDSLKVPDGAYLGFAWQTGSRRVPGLTPAPHAATAPSGGPQPSAGTSSAPSGKPTRKPSSRPSAKPSSRPSSRPSAKPTVKPSVAPSATPAVTPSGTSDGSPSPSAPTPSASVEPTPRPAAPSASASAVPSASPTPTTAVTESPIGSATGSDGSTPIEPVGEAAAPQDGSALPVWAGPAVLVVLVAGGLAAYLVRRRGRPSP